MPGSHYAVISPKRSLLTLQFLQRAQICMRSPPYGFVIRSNRSPSIVVAASELDGFAWKNIDASRSNPLVGDKA
ncbi:hypothetical protein Q1695_006820 [Nippostrongylus brasiliensis]|nr:hypothetical protein Q1695_006820 [Nippostrongylus brasiliensis]